MTDKLRAAMQAALEALEFGQHTLKQVSELQWESRGELAMQALRAALAEPEVERAEIGPEWTPCVKRPVTVHVRGQRPGEAHVSTREGLTPVKPDDLIMRGVDGEEYPIGRDLFNRTYSFKAALAEAEAEPVAWMDDDGHLEWNEKSWMDDRYFPVYRRPPRREWVGLTDEEREQFVQWMHPDVLERVEAALKEKNNG